MGILKTITEGGQIWAHRVRMIKQVLKIASYVSLVISALFFVFHIFKLPFNFYQASWHYLNAKFLTPQGELITIERKLWGFLTRQKIGQETISIRPETAIKICERYAFAAQHHLSSGFDIAKSLCSYTFISSILFFLLKGWRARQKQHVEGKKLISSRRLALRLKFLNKASSIRLGPIPLVKGTETHHILVSGATGTGKTNAFHNLLPQIRDQRQPAIIVDVTGEFVEKYYQKDRDILLNPFDARSAPWHPWCEGLGHSDLKSISQSFIPSSYREEESFWRKGAQEVFFAALKETAFNARTSSLCKLLLHDSLPTLATVLKGTAATAYLDLSSEKTAGSIRAVASSFLECLELVSDTENPFSIRQWIMEEKPDSWLFICCTPSQRSSLVPLMSAWVSIGVNSLLQLTPNPNRRLWFIIDELPRLHRVKDLEPFLTESRKYGGCGLLAIQSPAQLENIYGRESTSTILGNCATRIAFAEYDAIIAESISKSFGNKEAKESQEAISYGSHEMRDGVNLSYQTRLSSVVSPTALQSLSSLEAFVKLPGNLPISKLKLKIQNIQKRSVSFLPIENK